MVDLRYITDYKIKNLNKLPKLELLAKHFFFISPELIALNSYNLMYKFYSAFLDNLTLINPDSLNLIGNLDRHSIAFICYNSQILKDKGFNINRDVIKKLKNKTNNILCNKRLFFSVKRFVDYELRDDFFNIALFNYIWPYKIIRDEFLINKVLSNAEYFILNNKVIMYNDDFLYLNDLVKNLIYSWISFLFFKLKYFSKSRFYINMVDIKKYHKNLKTSLNLHDEEKAFFIMVFNYIKSFL